MALYMLSTDIAVCLIRGTSRTLDERVASAPPEELCISAVTRGELLLGVSRQRPLATGDEPTPEMRVRADMSQGKAGGAFRRVAKAQAVASPIGPATMESLRKNTHAVLAKLTPREAKALRMHFGIDLITDHTLEKVSKQFDATRERIKSSEPVKSRERAHDLSRVVDQLLARVSCLPWDAAAATHFATIAIELHRSGTPLGTTDTMVAGHAIAAGAVLVVRNENRFSRVDGLKTENWTRRRASP
jgi:predicted nucleic acid-binding protein